jgi:hypothetical protein
LIVLKIGITIGLGDVPQTIQLARMGVPPSMAITPPVVADYEVIIYPPSSVITPPL